ncbi:MAG: hypothetical protein WCJ49_06090 [Deltaproteobacteria bacterium]
MDNYQRIAKECFWDLQVSADDICQIVAGTDFSKKQFLFEKILLNSTRLFNDFSLFPNGDLDVLLENYKVPQFNNAYIAKRKNIAEVYFFNKPLIVDELKWRA